ncbi:MAG: PrsW family intramembrane metalloprotease, partial [Haloarcula sp.]
MGKRRQDPVEVNAERSADLYEISNWEPRSILDRFAHWLYYMGLRTLRYLVVIAAIAILLLQILFGSLGAVGDQPLFAGIAILSAVPALGLAVYIWYADVTTQEPLTLLVGTFLLGVLFAGFAG